jgi:hypothetical protein
MSRYSPLLNDFINSAYHKGLMPDLSVKTALAKIEKENKFKATSDLDTNVAKLASALYNKGLFTEARSLENKFQIFKEASIQFQTVSDQELCQYLDLAHPEGDTQVSNSQYGKFHTLQSTQQAIIDNLNHKQQKVEIKGLLQASADALGLTKFAQQGDQEGDTYFGPDPTQAPRKAKTDQVGLEQDDVFQLTADPELKAQVKAINDAVVTSKSNINKIVDGTLPLFDSLAASTWQQTTVASSPAKLEFYCSVNGFSSTEITSFTNSYRYFGGTDNGEIMSKIQVYETAQEAAKYIPANLASSLTGLNKSNSSDEGKYKNYPSNNKSIFSLEDGSIVSWGHNILVSMTGLALVSSQIAQWLTEKYAEYFSAEALGKAITKTAEYVAPLKAEFAAIKTVQVPVVKFSSGFALNAAISMDVQADKILEDAKTNKLNETIPEYLSFIIPQASLLKAQTSMLAEYLKNNALHVDMDTIVNQDDIKAIRGMLAFAGKSWYNYGQSGTVDKKDIGTVRAIIQNILGLSNALSKEAYTFAQIKQNISGLEGTENINNISDLKIFCSNIRNSAQEQVPDEFRRPRVKPLKTETSLNSDLIKGAQYSLGKPVTPSGSAPQAQPQGVAPQPATKTPESQAIARMQLLLIRFASDVLILPDFKGKTNSSDVNTIMRVGPQNAKSLTDVDGRWGPNTNASLAAANKYLNNLLQLGDAGSGMMNKSPQEVQNAANKNVAILSAVLAKYNIAVPGVADQNQPMLFEKGISISDSGEVEDGTTPLVSTNLDSLSALSQFVKAHFPTLINKSEDGDEGLTLGQWNNLLNSLLQRSYEKMQVSEGTKSNYLKKAYYSKVYNRMKDLQNLLRSLKINSIDDNTSSFILDQNYLKVSAKGKSSSPGINGKPGNGSQPTSRGDQTIKDLSGEGGGSDSLPFGKSINLDSYYWKNSKAASYTNDVISLQSLREQVVDQAARLFPSGDTSEEALQTRYLYDRGSNLSTSGFNADESSFLVYDRNGRAFNLANYKDYIDWSNKYRTIGSLNKYRDFLRVLLSDLHTAYQSWVRETQPAENAILAMQKNQSIWVQAINRALDDINRIFKV